MQCKQQENDLPDKLDVHIPMISATDFTDNPERYIIQCTDGKRELDFNKLPSDVISMVGKLGYEWTLTKKQRFSRKNNMYNELKQMRKTTYKLQQMIDNSQKEKEELRELYRNTTETNKILEAKIDALTSVLQPMKEHTNNVHRSFVSSIFNAFKSIFDWLYISYYELILKNVVVIFVFVYP